MWLAGLVLYASKAHFYKLLERNNEFEWRMDRMTEDFEDKGNHGIRSDFDDEFFERTNPNISIQYLIISTIN